MNSRQSLPEHIPGLVTLCNLATGFLSVLMAFENHLLFAGWLILLAAVLDFLDGLLARLLNAASETGKQLDSLADIVSFGVAPAAIVFRMMELILWQSRGISGLNDADIGLRIVMLSPVVILLCAAIRLSRFNVLKESDAFEGLATPAVAIFFAGICIFALRHPDVALTSFVMQIPLMLAAVLAMGLLMIIPVRMFGLKFRGPGWKGNGIRYVFLAVSGILLIILHEIALPAIIIIYLLLSIFQNLLIPEPK